jgi:hypothetical protein
MGPLRDHILTHGIPSCALASTRVNHMSLHELARQDGESNEVGDDKDLSDEEEESPGGSGLGYLLR